MANTIIKAVICAGVIIIVFVVLYKKYIKKIRELATESIEHKRKINILHESIDNFAKIEKRHTQDFRVLLQSIECQKCFCKKKPFIGIKELPSYNFMMRDVLDIKCEYKSINGMTEMCLAKDKEYIENKIKKQQADERKRVLGDKTKKNT